MPFLVYLAQARKTKYDASIASCARLTIPIKTKGIRGRNEEKNALNEYRMRTVELELKKSEKPTIYTEMYSLINNGNDRTLLRGFKSPPPIGTTDHHRHETAMPIEAVRPLMRVPRRA